MKRQALLLAALSSAAWAAPAAPAELKGLSGTGFDRAFLGLVIAQHHSAAALGKAAQTQAKDPAVQRFGRTLTAQREAELITLNATLRRLGGPDLTGAGKVTQGLSATFSSWRSTSKTDPQLVDAMITSRTWLLNVCTLALGRAATPEVRTVVRDLLKTQADSLTQLHDWRAAHSP